MRVLSGGGLCLTLGCDRIPLAAVSSVRGKNGSQGSREEEATAVVQVNGDSSDEKRVISGDVLKK